MSYRSSKKKTSTTKTVVTKLKNRAGENKPDLHPPIRFFEPKIKRSEDEDIEFEKELVVIKVAADSSQPLSKMNSTSLLFEPIKSFLMSGVLLTENLLKLQQEVFDRNGKTGAQEVAYRLSLIRRLLKRKARQEFETMLLKARWTIIEEHFGNSEEDKKSKKLVYKYSENSFYNWLKTEETDSEESDESVNEERDTERAVRASDAVDITCIRFERLVMFELGTRAWRTHNDAYDEHVRYLKNDIVKPITMSVQELILRFEDMYLLKDFIQPPSKKGQTASEANWIRRNLIIDKEEQRNSVFNALPKTFQQALKDLEEDWKSFDELKWLAILQRLEEKDKGAREEAVAASRERVKKAQDYPERPKGKVPKKPRRTDKTTSQGVARYCSLCKANGAPDYVFNSHSDANCFKKTGEKKMSGRAAERDSVKKDYRKQLKSVGKKYQAQKQELHALKKAVSKAAKNSKEFRKIKRKYAEKSDSDSSDSAGSYSDSESDSSASFESD